MYPKWRAAEVKKMREMKKRIFPSPVSQPLIFREKGPAGREYQVPNEPTNSNSAEMARSIPGLRETSSSVMGLFTFLNSLGDF